MRWQYSSATYPRRAAGSKPGNASTDKCGRSAFQVSGQIENNAPSEGPRFYPLSRLSDKPESGVPCRSSALAAHAPLGDARLCQQADTRSIRGRANEFDASGLQRGLNVE
jgi:hypothetical protein